MHPAIPLVQSVPVRQGIALLLRRSRTAVGPFLRLRGFPKADATGCGLIRPVHPLVEFSSLTEYDSVEPCRRPALRPAPICGRNPKVAPERLLSWAFVPHSTCGNEGPLCAGLACPLRSARRVSPPSRRFTPLEALPILFHTGSAFGISPSELSPPARYPGRFLPKEPTYRFSRRCSPLPKQWAGPSSRGFWALPPAEVLWQTNAV